MARSKMMATLLLQKLNELFPDLSLGDILSKENSPTLDKAVELVKDRAAAHTTTTPSSMPSATPKMRKIRNRLNFIDSDTLTDGEDSPEEEEEEEEEEEKVEKEIGPEKQQGGNVN